MKQLPDIDRKKLSWPEPPVRTFWVILMDSVWIIVGILAVLVLYLVMNTRDLMHQADDAKHALHQAHAHLAAVMNGRPLIDSKEGIIFIPETKVAEVKFK